MQVINHNDNIYTLDDDEDYIEYEAMSYTGHILIPFHFFDENVRDYLDTPFLTVTEHSTSNEQLFGETVDTHIIKTKSEDQDFYFDHSETTVAYFNGLEISLYSMAEWEDPLYFELDIIDFELR